MSKKEPHIVELDITHLSSDGYGIGKVLFPSGKQYEVEVPFTIPGDRVQALLLGKRRGVYSSLLQNIVAPSPKRIEKRCGHFERCGGCRWQHVSYNEQLEIKESGVKQCFGPLLSSQVTWHPIIPCQSEWHYRNKMEYSFSSNAKGDDFLGLMMHASRGKVMNLKECHLASPWFITGLSAVRDWWAESGLKAYHPTKNTGSLRTLTLREGMRTGDRLAMLTVSGNPDYALNRRQIDLFVDALRQAVETEENRLSIFIRIQQIAEGHPTQFYEMHVYGPDHIREELHIQTSPEASPEILQFHISPTAFFQPNTFQAEKLLSQAVQLARIPSNTVVYDLYCGTGSFGLAFSKYAKQVIGIELSPESALDAKTNTTLNHANNMTIYSGAVKDILQELSSQSPDVVVVDPPRAGLDPASLELIVKLQAPIVIYVSCNPKTQALNIKDLMEKGYTLEAVQPVDQFPQTMHVENIAILKRK